MDDRSQTEALMALAAYREVSQALELLDDLRANRREDAIAKLRER